MKNLVKAIAITAIMAAPSFAHASVWSVDNAHSNVAFKVRHMMVSNVKGDFEKFKGTVDLDEQDLTKTKVDVTIDAASINTSVANRDEHLKSADFFDVAKYPSITFVSQKTKKGRDGKLKMYGQLTMHGVTRDVVLDVEGLDKSYKDPWGNIKRGASATTTINRKDFGLAWNTALESGGVMVGDEVQIALEIELLKK